MGIVSGEQKDEGEWWSMGPELGSEAVLDALDRYHGDFRRRKRSAEEERLAFHELHGRECGCGAESE